MADEVINQEDNHNELLLTIEKVIEKVKGFAIECGVKKNKEIDFYVFRNNTSTKTFKDKEAFLGFIHPSEPISGAYQDLSLVFFPPKDLSNQWLVSLGVGSQGFKNDLELASFPGVRRLFSKLVSKENGFCKTDFTDLENEASKAFKGKIEDEYLKETYKSYKNVLQVGELVDINKDKNLDVFKRFVAAYAKIRDWASNDDHRKFIRKSLELKKNEDVKEEVEIKELLEKRKYIVLQGPPGTGKTRMAKKVAQAMDAKIKFIQFHAETSYSDFIYGIRPNVNSDSLNYTKKKGIFVQAIEEAKENKDKNVVLIIDEINRANLSNVLGPIFYLFEYQMDVSNFEIEICPEQALKNLPENLLVIATMNTADRSLAVVDFALRRRFAWYDIKPKRIIGELTNNKKFHKEEFDRFDEIFDWFADSNELALQPGQAYFIAESDKDMTNRLRYELFPLIKEYLNEGLLTKAKEQFNQYFLEKIQLSLFE